LAQDGTKRTSIKYFSFLTFPDFVFLSNEERKKERKKLDIVDIVHTFLGTIMGIK